MREEFIPKKFNADSAKMINRINDILTEYAKQGYDLSLRQLYYQLVSKNLVPNTERSYKNIGNLVSDARYAGLVDWAMIKDRGREMIQNPHWRDPADFMRVVALQFRFNLWRDQETYCEVMVEKQALEGVLEPVCRSLDVPFTANKGYSSSSALYEASKRFLKAAYDRKELFVIYLGDHDPSGIDMSRDVKERLELFLRVSIGEDYPLNLQRVALNMDQIEELNPPENPAKVTDSRAADYIAKFGESSWELDAIEPRQLAEIVSDAVRGCMDEDKFHANEKIMEQGRKALLKFADTFKE